MVDNNWVQAGVQDVHDIIGQASSEKISIADLSFVQQTPAETVQEALEGQVDEFEVNTANQDLVQTPPAQTVQEALEGQVDEFELNGANKDLLNIAQSPAVTIKEATEQ